jgi:hypothetical protein
LRIDVEYEDDAMDFRELLSRATSTKYTRTLEAEVTRLRAENRALLNSILGIAGIPPVVVGDNGVSTSPGARTSPGKFATNGGGASVTARPKRVPPRSILGTNTEQKPAPPMRRRSWHQIYRMLEINSARKKQASEII